MTNRKTAIHIQPSLEKGRNDYLILFFDEEAHARLEAGEDVENIQLTGFCPEAHGNCTIANIIIDMVDGKPVAVRTVEE